MNILPTAPSFKNPPDQFRGEVWGDMIAVPQSGDQRAALARVRFAPGARSAWHSHARGQFLHVTQGIALFGNRDGTVVEVHPGETLYTPPGEEHWHAAAPDCFMEHLALMEAGDDPDASVVWREHITDEHYGAARTRA